MHQTAGLCGPNAFHSNVQAEGSLKQPKKAIAKKNRFDDLFSTNLRKKILPFVWWRLV